MRKRKRVLVAMSGGVDSSVAAALLKKQGFEVIGATMCFNIQSDQKKRPSCCGIEGIEDARRVAGLLGIRHYVLNFAKNLEEKVISDFVGEYLRARTPNPCVRCNQYIKFGALLNKTRSLDCDYLATGHYARITRNQKYFLRKGKDKNKDQSYFLYCIKKQALPKILFPIGDYTKYQVRQIARSFGLPVAEKRGSQEICFIPNTPACRPGRDYHRFLEHRLSSLGNLGILRRGILSGSEGQINKVIKPGPIKNLEGKILGQHRGIAFYTIGQREGLGISAKMRLYVIRMDARENIIFVGEEKDTYSQRLIASKLNFISIDFPRRPLAVKAKIRYNHQEARAKLSPLSGRKIMIEFKQPQKAITPGQSVVFYDKDVVLGGGIIQSSFK